MIHPTTQTPRGRLRQKPSYHSTWGVGYLENTKGKGQAEVVIVNVSARQRAHMTIRVHVAISNQSMAAALEAKRMLIGIRSTNAMATAQKYRIMTKNTIFTCS